jgi:hypothetical protein
MDWRLTPADVGITIVIMVRTLRRLSQEELSEALSPQRLQLPSAPVVREVKISDYEDSTGEEALEIYLVLDPATRDEEREWVRLEPIYEKIRDGLRERGEVRYPYISAGTPEELERRYSYDPEQNE